MGDKLKIEVLNHLEKALYKPLPTELTVETNDNSEGWFHFHKNIWHPIGIVKESATPGKITKKDVVMDSSWKIEMEISVFGENKNQFDACVQVSGPTANNAYWFRRIVPHMDCEIQYQFRVIGDDSIEPLKRLVVAGTGILTWPPLLAENETLQEAETNESKLVTSPKKKTHKSTASASTPISKAKQTITTPAETPSLTASTRKRARIEMIPLEEENEEGNGPIAKNEGEEETLVRSSRRRKTADEEHEAPTAVISTTATQSNRKRRQLEMDDHDEDQVRNSRHNSHKTSQDETAKTPSKKLFATIDTPHATNNKLTKSSTKQSKTSSNSSSSSSRRSVQDQHETQWAEAKLFFSTLRAPPIAPPLVPKARLEFRPTGPINIAHLQKEKERDVFLIQGPLMTHALSYPLLDILQRDRHTTHRHVVTLLRHYFSLLEQQQQLNETRNDTKAKPSGQKKDRHHTSSSSSFTDTVTSDIAEIESWMTQYVLMPTAESLFERLVPRCIGLNQEKVIVRHLRALFEDAANTGVLFLHHATTDNDNDRDTLDDEKMWYEKWRDLHFGRDYPWAMLLGPHHFLRFLIYVVTSANHPIGSVPPVSSRIKGPMFDTEKVVEEAFKMLEQESPNIFF